MSLSNYEVLKVLGKGAFGTVMKVKNRQNGLIYAMKRIQSFNTSEEEKKATLNEVRLLYSLNHPNIISYKEAFYDKPSNSLNIVLEYCGDGDLSQKVKMNKKYHKRIDENTIWDWIVQLIIGIYYLHFSKCIHRDLKTANIFLKKNGTIKIGDLGVSKFLKNTLAETFTGTPLYMAPEMLNNLPYDCKVDIWSLGCIVYELCALEPPFSGRNMEELFKNIKAGRYIPIPNIYSNDLRKIIALMLQTNPKQRISSEELLYNPIIKSKKNKNYSKYQKLIESIKKPEIIQTLLPNQSKFPENKGIKNRSNSKKVPKQSKSKNKKPPMSARKKKIINKIKDKNLNIRASSAARNNLRNVNPNYNKNRIQKHYDEYSERDYDNETHQNYNYNEPSYYSKFTEQKHYDEYSTRDYDNKIQQNYNYNVQPSYYSKNNIDSNYNNNNNMNYNKKKNNQNKFFNLLKDSFGPIKKESYYDYDEFRPINNANLYNNYNNYKQIESKNNYYNMVPISKNDY